MEFNLPKATKEYAEIALAIGVEKCSSDEETAKRGIKKLQALNRACNIPSKLSELNIPFNAIDNMAERALEIQRLLKNNLRHVDLDDAKNIYKSAF